MWKKIERFLTSLRFVVVLMLFLSAATVLGMVFPQLEPAAEYRSRFGDFGARVIELLDLDDVYHSPWYTFGLAALSISACLCTMRRFSLCPRRLGFTLTHVSLPILAISYFIGQFVSIRGEMQVFKGEANRCFFTRGSAKDQVRIDFRRLPLPAGEGLRWQEARLEIVQGGGESVTVDLGRYVYDPKAQGVITPESVRGGRFEPVLERQFHQVSSPDAPEWMPFPMDLSTAESVELVIRESTDHGESLVGGTEALRLPIPSPEKGVTFASSGYVLRELPFDVYLEDFRLECYPEGSGGLFVFEEGAEEHVVLPARPGAKAESPSGKFEVVVEEVIPDFEYDEAEGSIRSGTTAFVDPAIRVKVVGPNGEERETWAFQRDHSGKSVAALSDDAPGRIVVETSEGKLFGEIPAREEEELTVDEATVRVARVFPDFVVDRETRTVGSRSLEWNNPAAQIRVSGPEIESATVWAFALHPDFTMGPQDLPFRIRYLAGEESPDGELRRELTRSLAPLALEYIPDRPRVKSFISEVRILQEGTGPIWERIEVNDPLTFQGYTLYQQGYDQEALEYTILEVKRDPTIPGILFGCLLLCVGVTLIYTVNPILESRKPESAVKKEA